MMRRCLLLLLGLLTLTFSFSQTTEPEKWDIIRCVEYAHKNNISVRQTDLQSRFSALTYKQSKAGQLPSLNFTGSAGYRLGRSENPTTGVLEDNNFFNTGFQLQSQVSLFNWFSRKNTIEANRLNWEADKEQINKLKNDIALNVAAAYLQILLAKEQERVADLQVAQTKTQLETTRIRVNAGALPELNAAELEAQLARDSAALIAAETSTLQFLLQMKALLNLDAAVPFDVVTPPIEMIPVEPLAALQPDAVYAMAIANLPQQKVNNLRIQSAQKSTAAAKAGMYPTISAFGSLSTNAISFRRPIYEQILSGYENSGARANAGGGTFYPVEIPNFTDGTNIVGYFRPDKIPKQFKNNFGQSVGIGLSVPIFNGRNARTAWERSQLNVRQLSLEKEGGEMQLKQDIYKAYNDATIALQQYNANLRTAATAQKAYDYAKKRYDAGLLSIYELIISRNSFQTARIQTLYAQYDYVFKMKVLEFYKGQGIKL